MTAEEAVAQVDSMPTAVVPTLAQVEAFLRADGFTPNRKQDDIRVWEKRDTCGWKEIVLPATQDSYWLGYSSHSVIERIAKLRGRPSGWAAILMGVITQIEVNP